MLGCVGGELGTYQTTAEHFGILDIDVCQPASKGGTKLRNLTTMYTEGVHSLTQGDARLQSMLC